MTRLLALLALLLAAGALTMAGCGDEKSGDTTTAEQGGTETGGGGKDTSGGSQAGEAVKIDMKNIEYVPKQATAKVGQKIDWTNGDSVAHTVTSQSGAKFDSGTLDPGDDFSFTPTKAGTINYVCEIHPNQTGTITVSQ
ncbi:MAG: cupredoxin domain-containing protein [Solirubrobacteraceae bacterium]